jgi:hypothetical protein
MILAPKKVEERTAARFSNTMTNKVAKSKPFGRPFRAKSEPPVPRAKALGYFLGPFHGQNPGKSSDPILAI